MKFTKIEAKSLKTLFIERMEKMIFSGELEIGEKLPPEREMAKAMNISRSVVNDGLSHLARIGFLTILPRQGTYVADYKSRPTAEILVALMNMGSVSNDYIHSILDLREIIMNYSLEKCIPILTKEKIKILEDICNRFHYAQNIHEGANIAYEFDYQLVEYSNNIMLPMLFKSFEQPNIALLERYFNRYGMERYHQRNINLLECMAQKNITKATQLMSESIQATISGNTKIYSNT